MRNERLRLGLKTSMSGIKPLKSIGVVMNLHIKQWGKNDNL